MPEELKPTVNQIKTLSNASRLQVMALLLEGERSISELAEEIGITPQTVYHHIHKLLDAGLIHISREEMCGNLMKRYYAVEEEWLDSSAVWDDLTLKQKKNYKLAALGTIKGMVNRGIKYIQKRKRIESEVGWVSYEKVPLTKENIEKLSKIFSDATKQLEELKEEEEADEEITVLLATLPG
ncbi:MAG: helix-turn-helix domain-containing protein [Thermoplasmata archaeon]